jgi:K+-transporting ATPase ATPase C chain
MGIIRLFFILTFLTGVLYPLGVTLVGQTFFSEKSSGSLLKKNDVVIGSELLAQKFTQDSFFHERPSAGDYATVSSSASQAGVTYLEAKEKREKRQADFPDADLDYWSASGSGLDPHITPRSALAQLPRVAKARGMDEAKLTQMILTHVEDQTWGIWGQPRVNVLKLNRDLSEE